MSLKSLHAIGAVLLYKGHIGLVHHNANRSRDRGFLMTQNPPKIYDYFDPITEEIVFSFSSGMEMAVDFIGRTILSFHSGEKPGAPSGSEFVARFVTLRFESGTFMFYNVVDDGKSPPLRDRGEVAWNRSDIMFAYGYSTSADWELNMVNGAMASDCTINELNKVIERYNLFDVIGSVEWYPVSMVMSCMEAASRYKGEERCEVFKAAIKHAASTIKPISIPTQEGSPKRKPKARKRQSLQKKSAKKGA